MHEFNKLRIIAGLPILHRLEEGMKNTIVDKAGKTWILVDTISPNSHACRLVLECPMTGARKTGLRIDLLDLTEDSTDVQSNDQTPSTDSDGADVIVDVETGADSPEKSEVASKKNDDADDSDDDDESDDKIKDECDAFKIGDVVLYDDGVWSVYVCDAGSDDIGLIPPSAVTASKLEKNKVMQSVKVDKVKKMSYEEFNLIVNKMNNRPEIGYAELDINENIVVVDMSGKNLDDIDQPVTIQPQNDPVKVDSDPKILVPKMVMSDLKVAIDANKELADRYTADPVGKDSAIYYMDLYKALVEIQTMLSTGDSIEIKRAQVFLSSLMSNMQHATPDSVVLFLANCGSAVMPLSGYFNKIKSDRVEK